MLNRVQLVLIFLVVLAFAGVASADGIGPVVTYNEGFEGVNLANGSYTTNYIPNWTILAGGSAGLAGVWDPTSTQYPGGIPEGENVAWINQGGIMTSLGINLGPYYNYDLAVDIGRRVGSGVVQYLIQVYAGGTLIAQDSNSVSPAQGQWLTSTLSFSTLDSHPQMGQALSLYIWNMSTAQLNVDNIRFIGVDPPPAHAPEPATLALFGSGLLAASLRKRFKR